METNRSEKLGELAKALAQWQVMGSTIHLAKNLLDEVTSSLVSLKQYGGGSESVNDEIRRAVMSLDEARKSLMRAMVATVVHNEKQGEHNGNE